MSRPPVHNVQTRDGRVTGFDTDRLTARPLDTSDAGWLFDPDTHGELQRQLAAHLTGVGL